MERFFGPAAGNVSGFPFSQQTKGNASKTEGVRAVSVPLEALLQNYVVSYGNLLNPDESKQITEATNGEMEGGSESQEGEEDVLGDSKNIKRRARTKQKKQDHDRFIGEYDLDDPFIDDDEVAVAYESIFDRMDDGYSDEDDEDSMCDEEGATEENLSRKKKKGQNRSDPDKPPLREFYVYRGDLQVEVVSKLKDSKRSASAAKKKSSVGSKKTSQSQAEDLAGKEKKAKRSVTKEDADREKKRTGKKTSKGDKLEASKDTDVKSTLERILKVEAELEKPASTAKIVVTSAARLDNLIASAPATSNNNSAQVSTEVSTKNSPQKNGSGNRRHFDYDKVYADLECRLAMDAIVARAKQIETFESAKFPSSLRELAGELAICHLRAAVPNHYDIEGEVFEKLAKTVPYSAAALRKVIFKKIIPLMRDDIGQRKLPKLYNDLYEEVKALNALVEANGVVEETKGQTPVDDAEAQPSATAAGKAANKFKFSEKFKQLLYEMVKLEFDLTYIERAVANFEGANPPKPLPHDTTLRRTIYQKVLKGWPLNVVSSASAELPQTAEISNAFGQHKRKVERKLLKEHGIDIEKINPPELVEGKKRFASEPLAPEKDLEQENSGNQPVLLPPKSPRIVVAGEGLLLPELLFSDQSNLK